MSRLSVLLGIILLAVLGVGCTSTQPTTQSSIPTALVSPATQSPTSIPPTALPTQPAATAVPTQPAATATAAPSAPNLSADEVYKAVSAAWTKMEQAGPRHVSQVTFNGDTPFQNTEADSVPPNYHQVISFSGTVFAEQYVYDGTIYNKAQGAWVQVPGAGKTFKSTLTGFAESLSDLIIKSDGKVVGVEVVNGKPAIVYSYATTLKGTNASTQYTVSVDQASGLLVKQIIIDPEGMKTVQTITYNASITLTLPDEARNAKVGK